MKKILTFFLLATLAVSAQAESKDNCWIEAGKRYNLDPWLLYSVAWTESRMNPRATNGNTNKSMDVGLMQINSWWFPRLKGIGIEPQHLFDPCTSINVGAWILATNFKEQGFSWKAIGAYNAKTEYKQAVYAKKVYHNYYWFTKKAAEIEEDAKKRGVEPVLDHPLKR